MRQASRKQAFKASAGRECGDLGKRCGASGASPEGQAAPGAKRDKVQTLAAPFRRAVARHEDRRRLNERRSRPTLRLAKRNRMGRRRKIDLSEQD
ncbi:hypothetical protein B1812_03420 [Methylocystis bryophila]|uniref:Uncharacterized protein n=1 Tax=Methylocystis bryophila TaxID=655015 RepID=A0A1W6MS22_9HYPH|nr:hypothetical protein B1812_03420 [Methylocystis bryophila]